MNVCIYVCIFMYHMHIWCSLRKGKCIRSSGTGIVEGYEPPCGCWEPNPIPLQKHQVLMTTEPYLQPPRPSSQCFVTWFFSDHHLSTVIPSQHKESHPTIPRVALISGSGCKVTNPCALLSCFPTRGGTDICSQLSDCFLRVNS